MSHLDAEDLTLRPQVDIPAKTKKIKAGNWNHWEKPLPPNRAAKTRYSELTIAAPTDRNPILIGRGRIQSQ